MAGPALAQTAAAPPPGVGQDSQATPVQTAQAPPAQAAPAQTAQLGLEDIIVSARRRVETIQDVPVAVSAIAPAQLENAAAPDIRDLVGRTPNLVIDPVNAGPSAAAISIRGISFEDIEKSFDPAVGVIIDGVVIGTNTGQLLDFFDFESIEVLRGPQGTLFGRNTTAGVISVQRTRPRGEWAGRVLGTLGNYGRRDLRAVLHTPAIGDLISFKFFYLHNQNDGFYNNVTLGERRGGREYDNYGASARLTLGDFDLIATYDRVEEFAEVETASSSATGSDLICLRVPVAPGVFVRPTGIPDIQCDRNTRDDLYTTFGNIAGFARNDGDNVTVNATLDLGFTFLTSVTGWRSSSESVRQDFDSSSINFFDTLRIQTYRQFSQELRANGNLLPDVDYVVGGYYFNSNYTLSQNSFFGPFLQAAAGLPARGGNAVDHDNRSTALFADVQWAIIPEVVRLTVGGRYTWDKKGYVNVLQQFIPGFPVVDVDARWSRFTPKVSVDWRFAPDQLAYASFARGYRAGGFNGRSQTVNAASTPYDPETVDSYEVGVKTQLFDRRLTFNLAGFITKYNDKQEEVVRPAPPPVGQETIVENAASATIKGIEAEFRALAMEGLSFYGSLGLLDASYDSFTAFDIAAGVPIDISTRDLRRTPDVSAGLGGDYEFRLGPGLVQASGSLRYVSSYQTTIVGAPGNPRINDPRGLANARTLVDASLGYIVETAGGQRLRGSIFGRNLTDDRGLNSSLPVAGLLTFSAARPPRTWGVELGFDF